MLYSYADIVIMRDSQREWGGVIGVIQGKCQTANTRTLSFSLHSQTNFVLTPSCTKYFVLQDKYL
jgi:hypothetical protein